MITLIHWLDAQRVREPICSYGGVWIHLPPLAYHGCIVTWDRLPAVLAGIKILATGGEVSNEVLKLFRLTDECQDMLDKELGKLAWESDKLTRRSPFVDQALAMVGWGARVADMCPYTSVQQALKRIPFADEYHLSSLVAAAVN